MHVRYPAHAGTFYADSDKTLRKQIEDCFLHRFGPGKYPELQENNRRRLISLISPHAGYLFSGAVAANGYYYAASDGKPKSIIILGPNHTGYGSGISIVTEQIWRLPFGDLEIDSKLATEIQDSSSYLDIDEQAHRFEHSVEVQLPFLQYIFGTFKFVPICMMMQDLKVCQDLGDAIAKVTSDKNVLIVASTDLTHYEPQEMALKKDQLIIDAILNLDEEALQIKVERNNISMCGYGPTTVAIIAAKKLGATKAKLHSYQTSGDIIKNGRSVVGYASLSLIR
jgi:AmmeMemoRadiSam system protein B